MRYIQNQDTGEFTLKVSESSHFRGMNTRTQYLQYLNIYNKYNNIHHETLRSRKLGVELQVNL